MKKVLSCSEYIIYILSVNLFTFILRQMPWTVLSGKLANFGLKSILESIFNLIIFLVTVFIIACFFKAQNRLLSFSNFISIFLRKILLPVLGIRILTDILFFMFNSVISVFAYIVALILEALNLFLIFYIINRRLNPEKVKLSKGSRVAFIGGITTLLVIAVLYAHYFISSLAIIEHITVEVVSRLDFKLQLINLLFSTVLWITLFIYFGLFVSYCDKSANNYKTSVWITRCFCLVVLSFLSFVAFLCLNLNFQAKYSIFDRKIGVISSLKWIIISLLISLILVICAEIIRYFVKKISAKRQ